MTCECERCGSEFLSEESDAHLDGLYCSADCESGEDYAEQLREID